MKKKFPFVLAFFLIMTMVISVGWSNAWFVSDKLAGKTAAANMATVSVELKEQSYSDGLVEFTIVNHSNIRTYLRAGIVFEVVDANDETPVIADTSKIAFRSVADGWGLTKSIAFDNGIQYEKHFIYCNSELFNDNGEPYDLPGHFTIDTSTIPANCKLIVNIVPEAIQADDNDDAFNYRLNQKNFMGGW